VDRAYLEPQVSANIIKVGKSTWLAVVSNKNISRLERIDNVIEE